MNTQPHTPASRNEVSKALIEALDRYMRQDETAGDTDNGVYRNAKVVMSDALSSRTEQAAPSVASEAVAALSRADVDRIVYACRQSGDDSTYAIVNAAIRAALAARAAPGLALTDGEASNG